MLICNVTLPVKKASAFLRIVSEIWQVKKGIKLNICNFVLRIFILFSSTHNSIPSFQNDFQDFGSRSDSTLQCKFANAVKMQFVYPFER